MSKIINFYEQVKIEIEKNNVIIFINNDNEEYINKKANDLFNYLNDIIQDKMNNLEAITHKGKYICVRRILNIMPKVNNPGYTLMIQPN